MDIKIPDGNTDNKFKYLERVLNRMRRRLHKVVTVAVPSIPVTHYAVGAESGILFRYFFITPCTLSKVMLAVHNLGTAESVDVTFEFSADKTVSSKTFTVKVGQNVLDLGVNTNIEAGTILRVFMPEPIPLGEYWLGFLCEIEPKQAKLINVGIDAIEETTNASEIG